MILGSQYLNLFLQEILPRIATVAHQQVGWISSVLIANIPDRSERGQLTDCIPGDYLFIWHSICRQPWVWKIFIWFWMIRYNVKREIFSNDNISWGCNSIKFIASEIYLAMDMCMLKHAYHQPICKNRGWFYIEEAIWNVYPMPHTTHLSHVWRQSDPQLQYQIPSAEWRKQQNAQTNKLYFTKI